MKILAIDPASELGWAISDNVYGVWDLHTRKDESMGMKLLRLKAKLNEIHSTEEIDVIVYERPGGQHKLPIIHQSKLIAVIEMWCDENCIEYRAYSASEIKKFATGKGNANKQSMIDSAKEKYGYVGHNDNEADALHLLNLVNLELQ